MGQTKTKKSYDRMLVIQDERERMIALSDFDLTLPNVDIFDEPTRCFKINNEWAKIVMGAVDLLCEIAVWRDADHEGYVGIQKILEFLKGADCMTFDCNDVEACLATSPTIATINAAIAQNSADIATNSADIATNSADIATNSADIAQNSADIALHAVQINDNLLAIQSNDLDIAQNSADIALHAVQINDNLLAIQSNDLELANHETRITALENSAGSGGGGNILTSIYTSALTFNVNNTNTTFADYNGALFAHTFTYPNALINLIIRGQSMGTGTQYIFTKIKCDGISSIESNQGRGTTGELDLSLAARFDNLPIGSPVDIVPQWRSSSNGVTARLTARQTISFTIIEYADSIPILDDPLVTFDAGSAPYTLVSGQYGIVGSGGNTGDCLQVIGSASMDWLEIQIDLGATKSVTSFEIDFYCSISADLVIMFYVDDALQHIWNMTGSNFTWNTFLQAISETGQVFRMRVLPDNPMTDIRIDNIQLITT